MSLILDIEHRLDYQYDNSIRLGPQRLQVFPRLSREQRLLHYQLEVEPQPVSQFSHLDAEGNTARWLYFEGNTRRLNIAVRMSIESGPFNPFDFILYPFESVYLPPTYSQALGQLLAPSCQKPEEVAPTVAAWAADCLEEAEGQTVNFLLNLISTLKHGFSYEARLAGQPHLPEDTLASRRGSCRDLSCLMIAACRWAGLAARFVSGYAYLGEERDQHELHAWVEVYLPGAGWRGFDPTLGKAVAEHHIVLAASAHPHRAAPLRGDYYGTANSHLDAEVNVTGRK